MTRTGTGTATCSIRSKAPVAGAASITLSTIASISGRILLMRA